MQFDRASQQKIHAAVLKDFCRAVEMVTREAFRHGNARKLIHQNGSTSSNDAEPLIEPFPASGLSVREPAA